MKAVNLTYRLIPESARNGRLLRNGDLLLEKSGGGETQPVGCVVLYDLDYEAVSSNFIARMPVSSGFAPIYLCYVHQALYLAGVNIWSIKQNTGLQNLDSGAYLDERFAFPPLAEQEAIAAFLDRETAQIDALIARLEELVALLQEKRQALISHAVTKGLDPTVPMKDSGVEWLGEIPAHWEVKRLKYAGEAIVGLTYDPLDIVDEGEGTLVLRASNVQNGRIVLGDCVFVSSAIPKRLVTRQGDILICSRSGSRSLIGKNARIGTDAAGVTFGVFITVFRSAFGDFLSQVFNSHLFEYQSGEFLT